MPAGLAPAAGSTLLDRLLRPGQAGARDVTVDVLWLLGLGLVMIGAGLGLRDPWPADEPRFALIAQDMLRSGDWLVPRVGGDLYADKPPLYFWFLAVAIGLTGSVRAGFLLPSLLAGLGTLLLAYDLLRRVHGREAALAGALGLLGTFQFVWQARHAQIDATLCFLTTLSLYGLLRHAVTGPARGWFLAGWAAAGLGVITKGVGFLPLLVLLPWALLARRGWPLRRVEPAWLWAAGPACLLGAIALWFLPMLVATSASPELLAYRNEILFHQTLTRYAEAWHHHEPFWYYLVKVVPVFWLAPVALLPWLWSRWRGALRGRDALTALLLAWIVLVLAFFSASSGKRGLYVLPAVPALAMAAAPWLPGLLRARGPRRVLFALAAALTALAGAGAAYFFLDPAAGQQIAAQFGATPVRPLVAAAVLGVAVLSVCRVRDGALAFLGVLAAVLVVTGVLVNPDIDAVRSGRAFVARVEAASRGVEELGLVGAKEQYLLELRRPSVNFGHARWRERAQEAADAAAWLAAAPSRALLVDGEARKLCFSGARAEPLGRANRQSWFLVRGAPDPGCVARGDAGRALSYAPAH